VHGPAVDVPYTRAKINAEKRHRAQADLNILDIRVFGYVSRFIDLDCGLFIADVTRALVRGEELLTDSADMVRDYGCPSELAQLIACCVEHGGNAAVDLYSRAPIGKFDLLDRLSADFGLRYAIRSGAGAPSSTGPKPQYYPTDRKAADYGYVPRFSSLEAVMYELSAMINGQSARSNKTAEEHRSVGRSLPEDE
jgi:hypothetical protein